MSNNMSVKKSIRPSKKLPEKPFLSFFSKNKMLVRLFCGYVLTFTVVELGAKICHILDSIMVSNLQGTRAMAAFGLTTPYTTAVEIISAIIVTGTQALYTRAAGKGDTEETNKIFSTALEVSVLISIVFTLILYLFNRQICIGLGASGENVVLYSDLMNYNLGFFGIVPFLIIYPFLCSMAALDGGKIYVSISAIILSVSDIGLNYLLSVPAGLGMLGIGLSSTISQVLAVVAIMPSFFRKTSMFRFSLVRISAPVVNQIVKIGLPKMTRKLSTLIKKVMLNRLTLFAGGVHLMTANSVKSNIDNLFMCLTTGICGASLLLTQLFFSERDKDAVRNTAYISIASVIAGPGALSVLLFVLAPIFVLPYGLGAEDAALTVTVLCYFSVSIVFISINELLFDYLQGVQKGRWAHVFIVFQRLTILPVAYVLIRLYGVKGLLLSYTLGEIPVTIGYVLAAWYLNRNKSEDSMYAFLCIPRSFDENKDHTKMVPRKWTFKSTLRTL